MGKDKMGKTGFAGRERKGNELLFRIYLSKTVQYSTRVLLSHSTTVLPSHSIQRDPPPVSRHMPPRADSRSLTAAS